MNSKTILFATDLSARCDRALDRSVELAVEWQARLVVVHAMQEPASATDLPSWRRPPDPRAVAMEQVRRDLRGAGGVGIEVIVERGDPASVILEVVERLRCDLIVTGVARNETLGRSLLGATVEKLTRHTEVPVLVVKSRPQGPYRKVVVATDFSEGSRRALETALPLLPDAQVSLFHAFDVAFEGMVDDKQAAREAMASHAISESHAFLAATPAAANLGRSIAVVCEYGEVGSLLRDFAQMHKVDLVVLGTEGRSRLANVFLGSVAQHLLEVLRVDTLVVRRARA